MSILEMLDGAPDGSFAIRDALDNSGYFILHYRFEGESHTVEILNKPDGLHLPESSRKFRTLSAFVYHYSSPQSLDDGDLPCVLQVEDRDELLSGRDGESVTRHAAPVAQDDQYLDDEEPVAAENEPWTRQDVVSWLTHLGYPQYAETFRQNNIDGLRLFELDAEQLARMGVQDSQHINELLDQIEAIRAAVMGDYDDDMSAPAGAPQHMQPRVSGAGSGADFGGRRSYGPGPGPVPGGRVHYRRIIAKHINGQTRLIDVATGEVIESLDLAPRGSSHHASASHRESDHDGYGRIPMNPAYGQRMPPGGSMVYGTSQGHPGYSRSMYRTMESTRGPRFYGQGPPAPRGIEMSRRGVDHDDDGEDEDEPESATSWPWYQIGAPPRKALAVLQGYGDGAFVIRNGEFREAPVLSYVFRRRVHDEHIIYNDDPPGVFLEKAPHKLFRNLGELVSYFRHPRPELPTALRFYSHDTTSGFVGPAREIVRSPVRRYAPMPAPGPSSYHVHHYHGMDGQPQQMVSSNMRSRSASNSRPLNPRLFDHDDDAASEFLTLEGLHGAASAARGQATEYFASRRKPRHHHHHRHHHRHHRHHHSGGVNDSTGSTSHRQDGAILSGAPAASGNRAKESSYATAQHRRGSVSAQNRIYQSASETGHSPRGNNPPPIPKTPRPNASAAAGAEATSQVAESNNWLCLTETHSTAIKRLTDKPAGTFVICHSENDFGELLVQLGGNKFKSEKLERGNSGLRLKNSPHYHKNLHALVSFYSDPRSEQRDLPVLLLEA
eukprot:m.112198 g.112198  ORF g.112198 m.112198 type:complete len:779 (+) comp9390_c1_seq1:167-2503(+)